MKISEPATALERLMQGDRKITLSYETKAQAMTLLDSIAELEVSGEPYFNENEMTVSFSPNRSIQPVEYDYFADDLKEKLKGYKPKIVNVDDFAGSEELYQKLSRKSCKSKVIDDKYSTRRGAVLIEYIAQIEKGLREKFQEYYGLDSLERAKAYVKKSPNHLITYYTLGEIEQQLLLPSSSEYFLDKLALAENEDESISARDSTRLQELELPLSTDDLKTLMHIRNAVMHFRVVTCEESIKLIKIAENFEKYTSEQLIKQIAATTKSQK